ncbi:MAG TPA: WS/DGAT domain-containing protein, partial [Terriglobales bacterium]|nr:WS/DGAT domain-containing protein [Terriglobales bacterium]
VRNDANSHDLGNRISLLPVTIPLGIRSPRRLLAAVHKRMEFLKTAHIAEIVGVAGGLIGIVPTALQAAAGPLAGQLPLTPFNLVCTNVPGPQFPLYLLGHKMLSWYPYVPIGGDMALNCAVLSYNGITYFGFSGDSHAVPDLKRLERFLQVSTAEMLKAAGHLRPRNTTTAEGKNKSAKKLGRPANRIKPEAKTSSPEDKTHTQEPKPAARDEPQAAEKQQPTVIPMPDANLLSALARPA